MVLSYVLVAVLAIGGYTALLSYYDRESETLVETVFRAVLVLGVLLVSLPLGALFGSAIVSAFTQSLLTGSLILAGAVTVVALLGFGLYTVAEGKFPPLVRRYLSVE